MMRKSGCRGQHGQNCDQGLHIKTRSKENQLKNNISLLADGEASPSILASLADRRLRATQQQLCDALGASRELNQVYRRLVKMALEELQLIEQQMDQLDHEI